MKISPEATRTYGLICWHYGTPLEDRIRKVHEYVALTKDFRHRKELLHLAIHGE